VLTKAINSRTGKPISKRLVAQYEMVEAKREGVLEQVRLKNIAMRNLLRKLEKELRAREHLAEGLHMIDFEQLKIENQSLSEKIEERGEELSKLKRKKALNVQLLSHVREKLIFTDKQSSQHRQELDEIDASISATRAQLTTSKRERKTMRHENKELTQRQGFTSNDLLIEDFEISKTKIEDIQGSIRDLKNIYSVLAEKLDLTVDPITGLAITAISPLKRSSTTGSLSLRINTGHASIVPFHTGVAEVSSPVRSKGGASVLGSPSNSAAGVLFSPINRVQRLSPMKGSPTAQLANHVRTLPAFPVSVMTPLRHNSSTGTAYVRKLPPLSK
jgi:archaellum component FlaC